MAPIYWNDKKIWQELLNLYNGLRKVAELCAPQNISRHDTLKKGGPYGRLIGSRRCHTLADRKFQSVALTETSQRGLHTEGRRNKKFITDKWERSHHEWLDKSGQLRKHVWSHQNQNGNAGWNSTGRINASLKNARDFSSDDSRFRWQFCQRKSKGFGWDSLNRTLFFYSRVTGASKGSALRIIVNEIDQTFHGCRKIRAFNDNCGEKFS